MQHSSATGRWLHLGLPALLAITGGTGLLYEVVLGRLLSLHLGSSGAAQAITLAAFLGGMSAGALLVGHFGARLLGSARRALLTYACLEAAIGVWALVFDPISDTVFGIYAALGSADTPEAASTLLAKLAAAGVLIAPMTMAMGATLPTLARVVAALRPGHGEVGLISRYYVVNAAGGTLGAAVAGFWAIEALGLILPLTLAATLNLLVGAAALRLVRLLPAEMPAAEPRPRSPSTSEATRRGDTSPEPTRMGVFVLAAAATGAVTLTDEVVWVRLAALLLGASVYAFAGMLVLIIAGITAGSGAATWAIDRGWGARRVFGAGQALAATATFALVQRLPALPEQLAALRSGFDAGPEHYPAWMAVSGGLLALHLLPAALGLGAAFPALLAAAEQDGAAVARATPWILGSNTLGNLSGAMLGGFVLMPALGLEGALLLGAACSASLGLLLWPAPRRRAAALTTVAVAAAATLVALLPPDLGLLYRGIFRLRDTPGRPLAVELEGQRKLQQIYRHDGKDASISVDRDPASDLLLFRVNGKADGSSHEPMTQLGLGHLGFLFRPDARDVFVVGLGTGQSAAAAASHDGAQVEVAELSAAVAEAAQRHFAPWNGDVLAQRNVRLRVADARELLHFAAADRYDIIVSEPSNPWLVGIADLFTVETYGEIARALRPNGVLVQWLQAYELSDAVYAEILCTLQRVLPHVAVFRLEAGDTALVASAQPLRFDLARAEAAMAQPGVRRVHAAARDPRLPQSALAFAALQLAGPAHVARLCAPYSTPLRLREPRLEYVAPRDLFAGSHPFAMLRALDQRVGFAGTPTFLAEAVAAGTVDDASRERLADFLQRQGVAVERPLIAALRPEQAATLLPVRAALDALPAPDAVPEGERAARCEALAPALRQLRTVVGAIPAGARGEAWRRRCAAAESPAD